MSSTLEAHVAAADRRLEAYAGWVGVKRMRAQLRTCTENEERVGAYRPHDDTRRCD